MPTEMNPVVPPQDADQERKRRRGVIMRLSLALVAVIGIGGAITTAAWQQQVAFGGSVEIDTFELQGAVVQDDWQSAEDATLQLPLPADALAGLTPADGIVEIPVWVRNAGSAAMQVDVDAPTQLIGVGGPIVSVSETSFELAHDQEQRLTILIDTTDMLESVEGQTASLVVTVTGTAL